MTSSKTATQTTIFQTWRDGGNLRRLERTKSFVMSRLVEDDRIKFPYEVLIEAPYDDTKYARAFLNYTLVSPRVEFDRYWVQVDSVEEAIDLAVRVVDRFLVLRSWESVFNEI